MNASIRIGVMVLMVFSIFSGIALADPIYGGGDAGDTFSTASNIYPSIPINSWTIYSGYVNVDDLDWYQLNTQVGEWLWYELDTANVYNTALDIFISETTTIGDDNSGVVYVNGPSWGKVVFVPGSGHGLESYHQFKMKRT